MTRSAPFSGELSNGERETQADQLGWPSYTMLMDGVSLVKLSSDLSRPHAHSQVTAYS